jgi:hypothetical protein
VSEPTIKLHLIVAQYKQAYGGQYMPNVVDCWDEYALEDNYEGYQEALTRHHAKEGTDYEIMGVRELTVEIPESAITGLFKVAVVKGQAKENK